jgi:hypothetical protein
LQSLASRRETFPKIIAAIDHAVGWLTSVQRPDGSLGATSSPSSPGWPTPLAVLCWHFLKTQKAARKRGIDWLLQLKGLPLTDPGAYAGIIGHDPMLIGWPWVQNTHSWLEPTATAVLACVLEGAEAHPRVVEGVQLIVNRALAHGGWNYGNTAVFGKELRPQPGPTGLALLALAAIPSDKRPRCIDPATAYLKKVLPATQAPISLGWGVLGLRAWSACPDDAAGWLAESFAMHGSRENSAMGLALLLLASGDPVFPNAEHSSS